MSNLFEYKYLYRQVDQAGWQWEFGGQYDEQDTDKTLLEVLNRLGSVGWELVIKESEETYILKRSVK